MALILLIHEDAMLRSRYRNHLERHGHSVSEIAQAEDQRYLPHGIQYDRVVTTFEALPTDPMFDSLPNNSEVAHGTHLNR